MENLPPEISSEILSRLPIDSALRCKCVCKTWQTLLRHIKWNDPNKVNLLFAIGLKEGSDGDVQLYYGEYDDDDDDNDDGDSNINDHEIKNNENDDDDEEQLLSYINTLITKVEYPPIKRQCFSNFMLGSCNGLVCFFVYHDDIADPIHIINPFTKEYVYLPQFICKRRDGVMASGFGYHPSTNEYKVVRIFRPRGYSLGQVQVYTLGGDNESIGWRNKGEITFSLGLSEGVFANGALHWIDNREIKIVTFDLADEEFRYLRISPPCFELRDRVYYHCKVLGGYFCVVHLKPRKPVDIWFLKKKKKKKNDSSKINYDAKEQAAAADDDDDDDYQYSSASWSWSKEFSIPWEGFPSDFNMPFALTKSNKVLMWYKPTALSCYDPKTATSRKLGDANLPKLADVDTYLGWKQFQAIPHIKSNVSLKALGERTSKRRRL